MVFSFKWIWGHQSCEYSHSGCLHYDITSPTLPKHTAYICCYILTTLPSVTPYHSDRQLQNVKINSREVWVYTAVSIQTVVLWADTMQSSRLMLIIQINVQFAPSRWKLLVWKHDQITQTWWHGCGHPEPLKEKCTQEQMLNTAPQMNYSPKFPTLSLNMLQRPHAISLSNMASRD